MSKFYRTKEFKDLNKEWAKKLADAGFKDIEFDESHLRQHSDYFKNQWSPENFETQRQYFEMAERFFNEFDFRQAVDSIKDKVQNRKELAVYKKIWRRYHKGMNISKIAVDLDLTYSKVYTCVSELEKFMFELYKVSTSDKV